MFFYPTVRLASAGALAVVSLSNGGADGLGAVRAVEMALAAERLGADVAVLDSVQGPCENSVGTRTYRRTVSSATGRRRREAARARRVKFF